MKARVQFVAVHKPLDGDDVVARGGNRQRQAGEHSPAVEPPSAGAAGALIAALLAAGQVEVLSQRVEQTDRRFDVGDVVFAVDTQRDRLLPRYAVSGIGHLVWSGDCHGRLPTAVG